MQLHKVSDAGLRRIVNKLVCWGMMENTVTSAERADLLESLKGMPVSVVRVVLVSCPLSAKDKNVLKPKPEYMHKRLTLPPDGLCVELLKSWDAAVRIPRYRALYAFLNDDPQRTQKELAILTGTTQSDVCEALARMVRYGLLKQVRICMRYRLIVQLPDTATLLNNMRKCANVRTHSLMLEYKKVG